ncbi:cannabidiolic acid synthase-like 2 [Gossypium australe]|uniref:Cannabidiolic acid synthase-like 2 n=1 Tax=Gossypium australe TaxID=47621 RepID=A0A5B6US98_9ROSI|nr:cannabidiolic acid synthase-like 2 [Gossypium australe]
MTIQALFSSMFLGGTDKLLQLMEEKLVKEDCLEISWAESDLYFEQFPIGAPLETLLGRNHKSALSKSFFKAKSDFVKQPIPEMAVAQVL